ncbi:MAG: 50S ribosomal protein L23 [Chitinophagales bacterium]|nr:50S ribosomal protein L23 [Chitinophagales bacterium]MDW8394291.1 50S ribosomal protein L23 [Chitinophagales bacterium]
MNHILIRPLISEKTNTMGQKLNRVGFVVNRHANKLQIKKAVEQMYGVTVAEVNTAVMPGKQKSRYTRRQVLRGMKPAYKKAYVTLAKGDTIDFYSGV